MSGTRDTVLRVTVLDHRFGPDSVWVGDLVGSWLDDAASWACPLAGAGVPLRLLADPAADEGEGLLIVPDPDSWPEVVDRAAAAGRPLITGRAPDQLDEVLWSVTAALGALVRRDLRGVLVLRLDDPGSSQRRHLESWTHDPVPPATWDALWRELDGFGRGSLFCCPGWGDDDGTVRRSRDLSPRAWASLDDGVTGGLAALECHGFAHLHPDLAAWTAAADRFDNPDWFRELGS